MAEPLRQLKPSAEQAPYEDDDAVSNVSPLTATGRTSFVSPIREFAPKHLFRPSGYSAVGDDSQGQEMDLLDADRPNSSRSPSSQNQSSNHSPADVPPQDSHNNFGVALQDNSNVHRVPSAHNPSVDGPRSVRGMFSETPNSSGATTPVMSRSRSQQEPQQADATHLNSSNLLSPASALYSSSPSSPGKDAGTPRSYVDDNEEFDDERFYEGFKQPPSYCDSRKDIHIRRSDWLSITIFVLSIYSTIMSGLWLVTAILQPRWGRQISSRKGLSPSTATTLAALAAKSIEMSFVTVFISFLGQVLTRRSFIRNSNGMTLAEITMRNWVIQPGSLITHGETLRDAGLTLLGVVTLTATLAATFYTTASDAMVAPKLKYGKWHHTELSNYVMASYANAVFVQQSCPSLLKAEDALHAMESCMNIQSSGDSYRNLLSFMQAWQEYLPDGIDAPLNLVDRPLGTSLLQENTTMYPAWIETSHGDVAAAFEKHKRIINNVTLAMPHPGVEGAAKAEQNNILQPDDLGGVGKYTIRAGVVSPVVNVLCANLDEKELGPLVYTTWPDAKTKPTNVSDQVTGEDGWESYVPNYSDDKKMDLLNKTDVDDIFKWGSKYGRRPPVFPLYTADYNMVVNSTVWESDSIYIMAKSPNITDYTLCQLRSWVSPNCSTHFEISGTNGASLTAHCEDPGDEDSYRRSFPADTAWAVPVQDWKWLADGWRLSMDLNGGTYNNNASNARVLTQLVLDKPKFSAKLPSIAEALAVYASSTLVTGSIDTPFRHWWDNPKTILDKPGDKQAFNASILTQEYTSGHVNDWQAIFYVILVLVFAVNLFCLLYLILRNGLVTDYTEPQNLFALAINSPPSIQLKGSCGAGPEKRDLVVPWRVAYAPSANHYFFEEANEGPWGGKYSKVGGASTGVQVRNQVRDPKISSYKRLSTNKGWFF